MTGITLTGQSDIPNALHQSRLWFAVLERDHERLSFEHDGNRGLVGDFHSGYCCQPE